MQCTWPPACWQPSHGPAHDVHGHQPAGNHHANTWGGRVLTFTLTWAMLLHSKCFSQGPCAARACLVKSVSPICDPQTWQTHAVASEIVYVFYSLAFLLLLLSKIVHGINAFIDQYIHGIDNFELPTSRLCSPGLGTTGSHTQTCHSN